MSKDDLGETVGRIHMERQDFGKLHLSKSRALKADLKGPRSASNEAMIDAETGASGDDGKPERSTNASAEPAGVHLAGKKRRRELY